MTRKLVHIRPSMCSTLMVPLLKIICKTLTEVIVCYFIILKVCSYTHQKMLEGMPSMYSLWTVLLVHWNDRKKFLSLKHSCRHLELSFWRANSFSCWYSHVQYFNLFTSTGCWEQCHQRNQTSGKSRQHHCLHEQLLHHNVPPPRVPKFAEIAFPISSILSQLDHYDNKKKTDALNKNTVAGHLIFRTENCFK